MVSETEPIQKLYEFLRKHRLDSQDGAKKMLSWDDTRITDFVGEAYMTLHFPPVSSDSWFSFSANSSLSGAPFPCASPVCRLENLDSLARFAALYADKVYITNPFEKYRHSGLAGTFARMVLLGDILGLFYLEPLFRIGLLSIQNNITLLCEECLGEIEGIEDKITPEIDKLTEKLDKMYLKNVQVELVNRDDELFLSFSGPERLIDHGSSDLVGMMPDGILRKYHPELGQRIKISKRDIRKNDLFSRFVLPTAIDLFQQNTRVHIYKTQYLTNRPLELDLVTAADRPDVAALSQALVAGLAHSIPTVETVPLDNLVKLREKEGEAFQVYRDRLNTVLKKSKALTPQEMQEIIQDEIMPQIHVIERTIKNSRSLLIDSILHDLVIGTGFLNIGIYSGLIAPEIGAIFLALGGFEFVHEVGRKLLRLTNEPEGVLEHPYYFLWRINRAKVRNP